MEKYQDHFHTEKKLERVFVLWLMIELKWIPMWNILAYDTIVSRISIDEVVVTKMVNFA